MDPMLGFREILGFMFEHPGVCHDVKAWSFQGHMEGPSGAASKKPPTGQVLCWREGVRA